MAQNNSHNFDAQSVAGVHIPDTRVGRGGSNPLSAAVIAAMNDIGSMRTYLASNGYTAATLDSMTANDMVFAIRTIAGGATMAGIR